MDRASLSIHGSTLTLTDEAKQLFVDELAIISQGILDGSVTGITIDRTIEQRELPIVGLCRRYESVPGIDATITVRR